MWLLDKKKKLKVKKKKAKRRIRTSISDIDIYCICVGGFVVCRVEHVDENKNDKNRFVGS